MIKADPIQMLVVLARTPGNGVPDTPLGLEETYFARDRFDPPLMYDNPAEDSDAITRNRIGLAKRRMPTVDHTFEDRKQAIQKRINRQIMLLNTVSAAHRAKFPNLDIYEPGSQEWALMELFDPKPTWGVDIVWAQYSIVYGKGVAHMAIGMGDPPRLSRLRGLLAAHCHWACKSV